MNSLLNKLFGLDDLGFGSEGIRFSLERPVAGWAWALLGLGVVLLGWWSYRRLGGPRLPRFGMALARATILLALLFLIAGPQLERPNTRIENDRVVVLLDRSGSMGVRDEANLSTRDEILATTANALDTALRAGREPKERVWLGFDATAYELSGPTGLGEADGRRTSLDAAVRGALRASAGRPLSAIVLVSDGRTTEPVSPETRQRLQEDQVPVFAIALGSPNPPADLAVARIEAPSVAFTGDRVPVRAEISVTGDRADEAIANTTLELVDTETGAVLARRALQEGDLEESSTATDAAGDHASNARRSIGVTLLADTVNPGERRWAVRLAPTGNDLEPGNDERAFNIALTNRPIRVAHIDGYPRWEYRYLRGLLLRETTIESVSLMLSPDRRFIQEGEIRLDVLPTSPEEWAEFDVIILGDVRPELFGSAALVSLREHVAERGAGLIWMPGPEVSASSWGRTELGDLLPFAASRLGDAGLPTWDRDVVLYRDEQAARRGLLALADDGLGWPEQLQTPATGWSRLRWMQRIDPRWIKPGAEVLAHAVPIDLAGGSDSEAIASGTPAVLLMRFGAGRSLYLATEETWRWRYGRGEDLQERFWLPLVRQLARARVERVGQRAVLSGTPDEATVGGTVRLSLELIDQALIDTAPAALEIEVGQPGTGGTLERSARLVLTPDSDDRRRYAGVWSPPESGPWTARVTDAALAGLELETTIRARWAGDEQREPAADHEGLRALAESTGGDLINPEAVSTLSERFPNRRLVLDAAPDVATLWDRPVWLVLLLLLLTAEWVGRKLLRLV